VYKFTPENLRLGSQLVVYPTQTAFFVSHLITSTRFIVFHIFYYEYKETKENKQLLKKKQLPNYAGEEIIPCRYDKIEYDGENKLRLFYDNQTKH